MILMIYTGTGLFLYKAASNPLKYEIFISFAMWVMFFAHGTTALVGVLTSETPNFVGMSSVLGGRAPASRALRPPRPPRDAPPRVRFHDGGRALRSCLRLGRHSPSAVGSGGTAPRLSPLDPRASRLAAQAWRSRRPCSG